MNNTSHLHLRLVAPVATTLALCLGALIASAGPAVALSPRSSSPTPATTACVPGQIQLFPAMPGSPYNHIDVGPAAWTFGWTRSNGCEPLTYRLHENLLASLAPGGNTDASKTIDYTLTTTSATSGVDSMDLLRAGMVQDRFYGCEQLDVAVLVGKHWQHRFGGRIVAPGAGAGCTPPPPVPHASIAVTCTGSGSYTMDNRLSFSTVTFTFDENGTASAVALAGGLEETRTFTGARAGTTVLVSAMGRTLAAHVATGCQKPPPPPVVSPGSVPTTLGPKIVTDLVGSHAGSTGEAGLVWGVVLIVLIVVGMILGARRRVSTPR